VPPVAMMSDDPTHGAYQVTTKVTVFAPSAFMVRSVGPLPNRSSGEVAAMVKLL
jgi:hypothetical protein